MVYSSVALVRRALRRSKLRVAILLALLQVRHATLPDLVRVTKAESKWIRGALHGAEETYRVEDSLEALGVVRAVVDRGVVVYVLTPYGRRVAESLRRDVERSLAVKPVAHL